MRHSRNGKIRFFYLFALFGIYRNIFVFMNLSINTSIYGMFLILALSYYLTDCLNFNKNHYKSRDFIISSALNFILFLIFYFFLKMEKIIIAFVVYDILQNLLFAFLLKIFKQNKKVLILGDEEPKEKIEKILKDEEKYKYIGFIAENNLNSLGTIENAKEIIEKYSVEEIIYTSRKQAKKYSEQIVELKLSGTEVTDYLSFLEQIEGKIDTEKIDDLWVVTSDGFKVLNNSLQKRIKRLFDIVMAILIFIPAFPFMIITYILVKLDVGIKYIILNPMKILKNPAFFKQKRIGFRGKEFEIIKFRSMKIHDPSKFSKYASEHDNRITKFGKFMRKMRLDELPQLINVLRGDMSFVGPRPEWNELGRDYEKKIKNYKLRYGVVPGLTGWAQVMYPYGASVDDAERKLEYDLYYIKHQDFVLDTVVFFKTIKIVLFGKGM